MSVITISILTRHNEQNTKPTELLAQSDIARGLLLYNNNNNNNNSKTISKPFIKYVSNKPGKHEVEELQKTATLGTAYILRKVLT